MNDNSPYKSLTSKQKIARNRAESEEIIFKLGGKLSAASKLGYTVDWLRRKLLDNTVRGSETLVGSLRGLLDQPKAL